MKRLPCFILCIELLCCCTKQNSQSDVYKLPIDSSLSVIMESTNLLNGACLPSCWPRDFSNKKRLVPYIIYIWDSTYIDQVKPQILALSPKKPDADYMTFDSAFHPLLDHLSHLNRQKISIQEIRSLSKPDVKMGLVGGSMGTLPDNALGYFKFSPVVVNKSKDRGVFFYTLIGLYNKSWVVSVQKKSGRWHIVNQYILGTS